MKLREGVQLKNLSGPEKDFLEEVFEELKTGKNRKDVRRIRIAYSRLKRMYRGLSAEGQSEADKILRKMQISMRELEGVKCGTCN